MRVFVGGKWWWGVSVLGENIIQRYDTRCYFNVRLKADISQLNLPQKSVKTGKKLKSKMTDMLRSNSKQSGKSI